MRRTRVTHVTPATNTKRWMWNMAALASRSNTAHTEYVYHSYGSYGARTADIARFRAREQETLSWTPNRRLPPTQLHPRLHRSARRLSRPTSSVCDARVCV